MTQQELELPKGWVNCKIKDVCKTTSGGTPSRSNAEYFHGNINWLKSGELNDSYILKSEEKISQNALENSSAKIFPENTILLAMYGDGTIAKLGILKVNASTNQAICAFLDHNEILENHFLFYYLMAIRRKLESRGFGGAQNNISQTMINDLHIPIPPLNEQKRIVSKIEELFSKIDSTKQSLEYTRPQLEQYRHSLLKSAFDGKLTEKWRKNNPNPDLSIFSEYTPVRFDDQNKSSHYIFEKIPKTWRVFELAQIADVIDPHPSHRAPPIEDEGFPFAGIGDIDENGTIDVPNTRKVGEKFIIQQENSYEINENSLGYGRVGTVGKVIRLRKQNFRYSLSPTLSVINNKEIIKSELLFYVLKSTKFFQQVSQNITGTTRAAIGIIKLRKILLSIPPMEEQEQIVSQIEQGFSLIGNSQRIVNSTLQALETMRMSVLKQAFEGKLVPQDPNDEPAEILLERIKKQKS